MTTVSLIIPAYNSEKTISKCLESAINQSYKKIEIIVVNDCSTDNTEKICTEYKNIDSRIKLINNSYNMGVSLSRNLAMNKCFGDYICFIDSDDYIENNYVDILYNSLIQTNSDLVFAGVKKINKKSIYIESAGVSKIIEKESEKKELMEALYTNNSDTLNLKNTSFLGYSVAKLYKKSFLEKYSIIFDSRYSIREDSLFNFNCIYYSNKIYIIEDIIYNYIINNKSATSKFQRKYDEEVKKYLINLKYEFEIKNLSLENYNLSVMYFYIMWCRLYALNKESDFGILQKLGIIKESFYNSFWKDSMNNIKLNQVSIKYKPLLFSYKKNSVIGIFLVNYLNCIFVKFKGGYNGFKNKS